MSVPTQPHSEVGVVRVQMLLNDELVQVVHPREEAQIPINRDMTIPINRGMTIPINRGMTIPIIGA